MGLPNKVFKVTGNKIASLVFADDSLRFSSKQFDSVEAFNESWPKSLTLATKVEVKYDAIKSISKEKPGNDIVVRYKGMAGLPSECVFAFVSTADYETLQSYFEKDQYFTRTEGSLSPLKSAGPYIAGFIFAVAITIFCHFQALEMADRRGLEKADEETGSAKTRVFNHFISFIGDKGVWAIGILVCCFIGYKIYKRYTNPPEIIRLLPPNN